MKSRIFSRLVLLGAVAIAAAAIISSGARFSYLPAQPPTARAPLPHKLASYLGVFEPGRRPATSRSPSSPRLPAGQAAEPGRLLQRLGGALPDLVRGAGPRPRRDPLRADRPHPGVGAGDRRGRLRHLPAHLCRQRPGLRPRGGHRLRARDEHPPVLVGLRARPAAGLRGRVAAYRDPVPQRGRRQRHLAVDHQPEGPGTGHIADWWPGPSYVTWVGIDGYYYRPSDTFARVFGQHHRPGADLLRQAHPAVRDRGGAGRRRRSPRSATCSTGCAGTRRSGWCGSTSPARRPLPPGLAHRGQRRPARRPSGWASRR